MPSPKSKRPPRRRQSKVPTPKPKVRKSTLAPVKVDPSSVELVPAKGSPGKGGDEGGEAWTVMSDGKRAGVIFINLIDEPPLGLHASIQIFLNQKSQRQGIGRVAYRKAAEASRYDLIFAHMRKSNLASRRAAEEAGFSNATPLGYPQLIMRWTRQR